MPCGSKFQTHYLLAVWHEYFITLNTVFLTGKIIPGSLVPEHTDQGIMGKALSTLPGAHSAQ